MRVLIANVGERDLYYNIGSEEQPDFCHFEWGKDDAKKLINKLNCQPGARHIAKAILNRLANDAKEEVRRCRYPILKTVIDHVAKERSIDRLVLVVTNQSSSIRSEYRDRDSVYTGEILKKLIARDYGNHVKKIDLITYDKPPTREISYAFFGELLPKVAPVKDSDLYASLSGGIPALNDSLQEQALRLYRDRCHLYEVHPPSEEECCRGAERGELKPVSVKPFLRDLAISIIEQLLNRYDYSGALEVLRMFSAVKFWDDEVEAVLKHAERRINLNFKEAADALQTYRNQSTFQAWWKTANQPQMLDHVIEAYFLAESRYRNHEYADMLWRIRAIFEIGNELLASINATTSPEQQQASRLLYSLLGLKNLSNDMLHDLKGVSIGKINNAFQPPQEIRNKHKGKENHEFVIPTVYEITVLLSSLMNRSTTLLNPYQEINDYLLGRLRG